ncbi:MAG: phosphoribosylglycinamide formyltransferase [Desulfosarcinaceae bacterium]|jgi:phosphoribosylglycinamide formyltransferase-1
MTIKIGALISGGGTNLQAIIDACEKSAIDAQISVVGSDNPDAKGLGRAEKHGIPRFVVDYKKIITAVSQNPQAVDLPTDVDMDALARRQTLLPDGCEAQRLRRFLHSRVAAEAALIQQLAPFGVELVVLAGFMRTLTPYFIDHFNTDPSLPRIMNIHPALLPSFPGVDGYGDTFRYGCKVGGCTVHFIDYGEDTGPIIGQRAFAIQETDTLEEVQKKGLALEWELYPQCIQWFAEHRLRTVTLTYDAPGGGVRQRTVVKIAQ